MRLFLGALLCALVAPSLGWAQTLGPFRIGMNTAEVEAALPSATWDDDPDGWNGSLLMRRSAALVEIRNQVTTRS